MRARLSILPAAGPLDLPERIVSRKLGELARAFGTGIKRWAAVARNAGVKAN